MAVGAAGRLRVPAGSIDAAREVLTRTVQCSRDEAGCLAYSIAEDLAQAGDFWVLEIWRDEAALEAHRATDHMRELRHALGAFGVEVAVQRWSDVPWSDDVLG